MATGVAVIGLGGGCHWCTEAVFKQLKGVGQVKQGYIKSIKPHNEWSEGILLTYSPKDISLAQLVGVHLCTHAATVQHSMRDKYRSAVYYIDERDKNNIHNVLSEEQHNHKGKLITQCLKIDGFRESRERLRNYYGRHPQAPFCTRYIAPKFEKLKRKYPDLLNDAL